MRGNPRSRGSSRKYWVCCPHESGGTGGFGVLLRHEGTIKSKLFPFFCAIVLCMVAFHSNICQLKAQSWLAKLQVSFLLASPSKEKGQRHKFCQAPPLSGREALCRCPLGSYWQNWLSCLSVDQQLKNENRFRPIVTHFLNEIISA